jgi:hypothetical protein
MNEYLANALRNPAEDWIPDLFYEDFQRASQWVSFIQARFPDGVSSILEKEHGWSARDFQALYVACWIYKPVVKGSYMLRLFDEHETGVQKAYKKKLSSRGTSHLHGPKTKGANASSGWRFLRGYHELLVQIEDASDGKYLFLKCEGNPAISYAHYKSWQHKKKTGQGLDVNEALLTAASSANLHLGIKIRRAENYSTAYRELLQYTLSGTGQTKLFKKQGEIINTRQAAAMIVNGARRTAKKDEHLKNWLQTRLQQYGVGSPSVDLPPDYFDGASNYAVGMVFRTLAAFADQAHHVFGSVWLNDTFLVALRKAQQDVASIGTQLLKDFQRGNTQTVRYFEEVTVHPFDIDHALEKALMLLAKPKE